MGRYRSSVVSSATLAAGTAFFYLGAGSTGDFLLRRATIGMVTNTAVVPTSQQIQVSAQPATGLTPGTSAGVGLLRGTSRPALVTPSASATGTATTVGPPFILPYNSQSGIDLPWEQIEEWIVPASSTLVFTNVGNALPSGHQIALTVEWEE
jgi:hypothetical protein